MLTWEVEGCGCVRHAAAAAAVALVCLTQGGSADTSYFDEEFTSEPVVDSVAPASALSESKGTKFDGFTFVDKSTLAAEE